MRNNQFLDTFLWFFIEFVNRHSFVLAVCLEFCMREKDEEI